MDVFKWCVRPGLTIKNEPSRKVVQFGDGYQQFQATEVNGLLRKYNVVVRVKLDEYLDVDDFLAKHLGVKPFLFNDPYTKKQVKVVCGKWPVTMSLKFAEFNCEFEEVA